MWSFCKNFNRKIGDREFKKRVLKASEKEVNKEIFFETLEQFFPLIKDESLLRFKEFVDRLFLRYVELREVEVELVLFEELSGGKIKWDNPRILHDVQLDLVNRTESFNQQFYAVLSAFIKLISHISPRSFSSRIPIRSTRSFIDFCVKECGSFVVDSEAEILKKAVLHRDVYVDHTSQHKVQNWYTFSSPEGKVFVIYFEGQGKGEFKKMDDLLTGLDNPIPIKVLTPFSSEKFFSAPHHSLTMIASIHFFEGVIKYIKKLK